MPKNLNEELAAVDALKRELDFLRPLKPEQEQRVFDKLRLDWNYHSNAIEGNQLTPGETRLLLLEGLTADGKPLKDYLDIEGHNHVTDWLLDYVRRKEELTEVTIRGMHEILLVRPYEVTAVTPEGGKVKKTVELGKYKNQPNQVTTPTGAIRRFALPEETPVKMGELMKWLRAQQQSKELHPITVSAIFHHEFVSIHPFDDGNGRMARLLMNLILMQSGYPPAIIQLQDRDAYFLALARADANDRESFISFIADKVGRSVELYLRGARGESVEDYDDIDKKITLLKRELDHLPEPRKYDQQAYVDFMENSGTKLFQKVFRKLSAFDDLYAESWLNLQIQHQGARMKKDLAAVFAEALPPRVVVITGGSGAPQNLQMDFSWDSFKKAGLDHFNDRVMLGIQFFRLKYQITWTGQAKNKSMEQLYGPALSDEDCNKIANDLAQHCFDTIQSHRSKA